jgi:mxaJ protein
MNFATFISAAIVVLSVAELLCGASVDRVVPSRTIRVCADPNNFPFSNDKLEGFENKLADVIGTELHAKIEYVWWLQRKNFVRNTLNSGKCDLIIGILRGYERIATTRPYYKSTYVWVSRKDKHLKIASLDDPILQKLRIGVHITDDNYAPPAQALARRGLVNNLKGYSLLGAFGDLNPPAKLVNAVANREVDLAIAWGPLVGYFTRNSALQLSAMEPLRDGPIPFTFEISMGVRKNDTALLEQLDRALERRQADVRRILAEYRVPVL